MGNSFQKSESGNHRNVCGKKSKSNFLAHLHHPIRVCRWDEKSSLEVAKVKNKRK